MTLRQQLELLYRQRNGMQQLAVSDLADRAVQEHARLRAFELQQKINTVEKALQQQLREEVA